MREILSLPPQIIYIFAFLPSLLCHVQLVAAVEEPEPAARGSERKEGEEGEPAMGTRHADRYSWRRAAARCSSFLPPSLPPTALARGRAARRPPQHPVKRGGGGGEEAGEGEGTDPAAAVEVVGPVSQVVVVVSWPDGAGWPQTSARGNFQGKSETSFESVPHEITDVCSRFLS